MKRSAWRARVVLALVLYLVALGLTTKLRWDPEPVRLALVVALLLALIELLVSAADSSGASWRVDPVSSMGQPGRDAMFSTYLRIVEGHLTAKTPDSALRDRLGTLADRRLVQRHGVRRNDPRGAALLGPELMRDLDGPPRRLGLSELERHLTRIEEL